MNTSCHDGEKSIHIQEMFFEPARLKGEGKAALQQPGRYTAITMQEFRKTTGCTGYEGENNSPIGFSHSIIDVMSGLVVNP